jgi:hypothetical protein
MVQMVAEASLECGLLTRREALVLAGWMVLGAGDCGGPAGDDPLTTSPWTETRGGSGGRVLRIKTLAPAGPGSLAEACRMSGPRRIVFDVGGVIDLGKTTLDISFPDLTIEGETAPEPGITLIRGGINVIADHVIIRHLRVRTGSAGAARGSGWERDCVNVYASRHVVVDHCSLSWGTDENLSASGPPFNGQTPAQWRRNTSSNVVFSRNLIAEGLSHSTHSEGEHSKGALVNSNVTEVLFFGNMFANNRQRNPMFNGGCSGAVVNNFIFNPGTQAIMLSARLKDWGDREMLPGRVAIIGNVLEPGPSSSAALAMVSATGAGAWQLYLKDNIVRSARAGPQRLIAPNGANIRLSPEDLFPNYPTILPSEQVRQWALRKVGARPWSRDAIDRRVIADARIGNGALIDHEDQVGGYPR